jgi:predicted Rossmann-fold nucleotide-binding protein
MRTVALAVVCLFTFTTIAESAPILHPGYGMGGTEIAIDSALEKMSIPSEYGTVKEIHIARRFSSQDKARRDLAPAPVVIQIEDAHSQRDAQKNINNLTRYLSETYGIKTIFVEGGMGELEPDLLRFFHAPDLNDQLLERLQDKGLIGGLEKFLSAEDGKSGAESFIWPGSHQRSSAIRAFGVEDLVLYRKNLDQFRAVYAAKPETDLFLEKTRQDIVSRGHRIFGKELKDYFSTWMFQNETDAKITERLSTLQKYAADVLDLDFDDAREQYDWPQLVRFFKIKTLEKKGDGAERERVRERKNLVSWLEQNGLGRYVDDFQFLVSGPYAPNSKLAGDVRSQVEQFYELAVSKGFRFGDYPHLTCEIGIAILSSELQAIDLLGEAERLNDLILQSLARTEEEKNLILEYKEYRLLRKLFALELTREEYQRLKNKTGGTGDGEKELKWFSGSFREEPADRSKLPVAKAMSFYEIAEAREQVMFENIRARMEELQTTRSILITGGYHSKGLVELFRQGGISYVRIAPRIAEINSDNSYHHAMMLGQSGTGALTDVVSSRAEGEKSGTATSGTALRFATLAVKPELFEQAVGRPAVLAVRQELRDSLREVFRKAGKSFSELNVLSSKALAAHGLASSSSSSGPVAPETRIAALARSEFRDSVWTDIEFPERVSFVSEGPSTAIGFPPEADRFLKGEEVLGLFFDPASALMALVPYTRTLALKRFGVPFLEPQSLGRVANNLWVSILDIDLAKSGLKKFSTFGIASFGTHWALFDREHHPFLEPLGKLRLSNWSQRKKSLRIQIPPTLFPKIKNEDYAVLFSPTGSEVFYLLPGSDIDALARGDRKRFGEFSSYEEWLNFASWVGSQSRQVVLINRSGEISVEEKWLREAHINPRRLAMGSQGDLLVLFDGQNYRNAINAPDFRPQDLGPVARSEMRESPSHLAEHTGWRRLEGEDRDRVIAELMDKDQEGVIRYFARWVRATSAMESALWEGWRAFVAGLRFAKIYFNNHHKIYHQQFVTDSEGRIWILKKRRRRVESETPENDLRVEMLVYLLLKDRVSIAEIHFLTEAEAAQLGIPAGEAGNFFLSRVVLNDGSSDEIGEEELRRSFSRIFVADVWLRKVDHMVSNYSFRHAAPVSIDQEEALDYLTLAPNSEGLAWFILAFLLNGIWQQGYTLIAHNWPSLREEMQLKLVLLDMMSQGLKGKIGAVITTAVDYGLLAGFREAEMLDPASMREAVEEFQSIDRSTILATAREAGYQQREAELVVDYIVAYQKTLASDVRKLWIILNADRVAFEVEKLLSENPENPLSDIREFTTSSRSELRSGGRFKSSEAGRSELREKPFPDPPMGQSPSTQETGYPAFSSRPELWDFQFEMAGHPWSYLLDVLGFRPLDGQTRLVSGVMDVFMDPGRAWILEDLGQLDTEIEDERIAQIVFRNGLPETFRFSDDSVISVGGWIHQLESSVWHGRPLYHFRSVYESHRPESSEFRRHLMEIVKTRKSRSQAAGKILVIGPGMGHEVLTLLEEFPEADFYAADINPLAVANTRANVALAEKLGHKTDKVRVVEGDVFSSPVVRDAGTFDLIVFNAPLLDWDTNVSLEDAAVFSSGLDTFLEECANYLTSSGAVILGMDNVLTGFQGLRVFYPYGLEVVEEPRITTRTGSRSVFHLRKKPSPIALVRNVDGNAPRSEVRERGSSTKQSLPDLFPRMLNLMDERRHVVRTQLAWVPAVVVFGSARIPRGHPYYQKAVDLGEAMWRSRFVPRTGAGPSIMEAVPEGYRNARRLDGVLPSLNNQTQGVKIELPFETEMNSAIEQADFYDKFITRKLALHENIFGAIALPGGFGTLDEVFEVWRRGRPVVLLGKDFWKPVIREWYASWEKAGLTARVDLRPTRPYITDDVSKALRYIEEYSNRVVYKTDRYALRRILKNLKHNLIRLRQMPRAVTMVGRPVEGSKELVIAEQLAYRIGEKAKIPVRVASRNLLLHRVFDNAEKHGWLDLLQAVLFYPASDPSKTPAEKSLGKRLIRVNDESNHQFLTTNNSYAFVFFPGGVGTMNKLFDILQIMQTNKGPRKPIILVGRSFWQPIKDAIIRVMLHPAGQLSLIAPYDPDLLRVVDTVEEAWNELNGYVPVSIGKAENISAIVKDFLRRARAFSGRKIKRLQILSTSGRLVDVTPVPAQVHGKTIDEDVFSDWVVSQVGNLYEGTSGEIYLEKEDADLVLVFKNFVSDLKSNVSGELDPKKTLKARAETRTSDLGLPLRLQSLAKWNAIGRTQEIRIVKVAADTFFVKTPFVQHEFHLTRTQKFQDGWEVRLWDSGEGRRIGTMVFDEKENRLRIFNIEKKFLPAGASDILLHYLVEQFLGKDRSRRVGIRLLNNHWLPELGSNLWYLTVDQLQMLWGHPGLEIIENGLNENSRVRIFSNGLTDEDEKDAFRKKRAEVRVKLDSNLRLRLPAGWKNWRNLAGKMVMLVVTREPGTIEIWLPEKIQGPSEEEKLAMMLTLQGRRRLRWLGSHKFPRKISEQGRIHVDIGEFFPDMLQDFQPGAELKLQDNGHYIKVTAMPFRENKGTVRSELRYGVKERATNIFRKSIQVQKKEQDVFRSEFRAQTAHGRESDGREARLFMDQRQALSDHLLRVLGEAAESGIHKVLVSLPETVVKGAYSRRFNLEPLFYQEIFRAAWSQDPRHAMIQLSQGVKTAHRFNEEGVVYFDEVVPPDPDSEWRWNEEKSETAFGNVSRKNQRFYLEWAWFPQAMMWLPVQMFYENGAGSKMIKTILSSDRTILQIGTDLARRNLGELGERAGSYRIYSKTPSSGHISIARKKLPSGRMTGNYEFENKSGELCEVWMEQNGVPSRFSFAGEREPEELKIFLRKDRAERVSEYLESHLKINLSLRQLADELGSFWIQGIRVQAGERQGVINITKYRAASIEEETREIEYSQSYKIPKEYIGQTAEVFVGEHGVPTLIRIPSQEALPPYEMFLKTLEIRDTESGTGGEILNSFVGDVQASHIRQALAQSARRMKQGQLGDPFVVVTRVQAPVFWEAQGVRGGQRRAEPGLIRRINTGGQTIYVRQTVRRGEFESAPVSAEVFYRIPEVDSGPLRPWKVRLGIYDEKVAVGVPESVFRPFAEYIVEMSGDLPENYASIQEVEISLGVKKLKSDGSNAFDFPKGTSPDSTVRSEQRFPVMEIGVAGRGTLMKKTYKHDSERRVAVDAAGGVFRLSSVLRMGKTGLSRALGFGIPAVYANESSKRVTTSSSFLLADPSRLKNAHEQIVVIFDEMPAAGDPVLETLIDVMSKSGFLSFQIVIPGLSMDKRSRFEKDILKRLGKNRQAARAFLNIAVEESRISGFVGRNSENLLVYDMRENGEEALRRMAPEVTRAGRGKGVLFVYNDDAVALDHKSLALLAAIDALLEKHLPGEIQPASAILAFVDKMKTQVMSLRAVSSAA